MFGAFSERLLFSEYPAITFAVSKMNTADSQRQHKNFNDCLTSAGHGKLCKHQVPYRQGARRMINYSVSMITNPMEQEESLKAYARAQMSELMSFDKFIQHIADHNGVYTRGTVQGVITDMCQCLVEQLLEGKKVQLGVLGDFWVSLNSECTNTIAEFTSKNIKAVNILFTPGPDFENLIGRAEFNLVPYRAVQAATLKAIKAGESTVDIAATKSNGATSGSEEEGPSGTPLG